MGFEQEVSYLHDIAMNLAESGYWNAAYTAEKEAANKLYDRHDLEPSRSVLYRSAGELALRAGKFKDALSMVELGLAGEEVEESGVKGELEDLKSRILKEFNV